MPSPNDPRAERQIAGLCVYCGKKRPKALRIRCRKCQDRKNYLQQLQRHGAWSPRSCQACGVRLPRLRRRFCSRRCADRSRPLSPKRRARLRAYRKLWMKTPKGRAYQSRQNKRWRHRYPDRNRIKNREHKRRQARQRAGDPYWQEVKRFKRYSQQTRRRYEDRCILSKY